ncbi:MAG: S-layer homology domain-containing protein [Cyanobacteria bacterium CRU_2_1]|nr:S-layer homology domain-containing protein [Cyanobacteria bacterium CRU_2_1]
MLSPKKSVLLIGFALCAMLPACASSPWAQGLQRSLAPDPRLGTNPVTFGNPSAEPSVSPGLSPTPSSLPLGFPAEIPRYPNAELLSVKQPDQSSPDLSGSEASTQTRWMTADSGQNIEQFYRQQFQTEGWQVSPSGNATDSSGTITAQRNDLQVTVAVAPSGTISETGETEFTIDYRFSDSLTVSQSPVPSPNTDRAPQPGDPDFVGPVPLEEGAIDSSPSSAPSQAFSDLSQASAQLQPYITDLATLGALPLKADDSASTGGEFKPNAAITRREYARWLVTANNLIYATQPTRQIRLETTTDQAAFQDVPTSDPDFGVIQGLANAGLIPSPLSGNSTVVTFRPDAPLTREDLILWKEPLDLRRALPTASIDAVQQTWGFQDAAQIDPNALRAVLADFQNGDLSNIRRAFGYTTLFQPKKSVTRAEAAAVLWHFGSQGDGLTAKDALQIEQQAN